MIDPNLKRDAINLLTIGRDIDTLAILKDGHIAPLSLLAAVIEIDEEMREMLEPLYRAHLKLSVAVKGAGRRDLKELINPYKIYSFYPIEEQGQHEENVDMQRPEKKRRLGIF